MGQGQPGKVLVSRRFVRRTGEGAETLTVKVETGLPRDMSAEEFVSILKATISRTSPGLSGVSPASVSFTKDSSASQMLDSEGVSSAHGRSDGRESLISTRLGMCLLKCFSRVGSWWCRFSVRGV